MRQVLIKSGSVCVADVPAPQVGPRSVLVRVHYSCISAGTEMASVRVSGLPLYKRALRQPENLRRVMQMIHDQGLSYTIARVQGKIASGSPTGYSAAGTVIAVGPEVDGFSVGDRVACAGAGIANHAEVVDVPVNLTVRVPDGLGLLAASTVTLGAIALQGVRRTAPTIGETIVVVGLGLLGQLCAQMLRANGCAVIGVDPDASRRAVARGYGVLAVLDSAEGSHVEQIHRLTDGNGADAVLITAASSDDEIVSDAFQACRRKGRVVLVGDVGLKLRRSDFYAKEIDFLISASYGPGRYDPFYEEGGQDYPLAYVRWTENRNMSAFLALLAQRQVDLTALAPRCFPLEQAAEAYAALGSKADSTLVAILEYAQHEASPASTVALAITSQRRASGRIRVGLIGAGGFAQGMHLPNLQRLREHYEVRGVVSRTGANATAVARQYGAAYASTDSHAVLDDPDVDVVLIATRHNLHASLALAALKRGKHVLVEKPLALLETELAEIEQFYSRAGGSVPLLMTGFNRRFSPAIESVRKLVTGRTSPLVVSYRMNAGYIPADSWVHGPEGGGRNIGEACHIYDLFAAITGARPVAVEAQAIAPTSVQWRRDDNFTATIGYSDGSVCSLTYTALGAKAYPKERMEVFCDGLVASLDDYRSLTVVGRRAKPWSAAAPEKGQLEELVALAGALRDGQWPISLADQLAATRVSFEVQRRIMDRAAREAIPSDRRG
jgi:predicted dehydrogenase/threonine dehydrogenase-like Zn-dependent dehydrogenase